MRLFLFQLLLIIICSCKSQNTEVPKQMNQTINSEIAVKFLNDYVSFCDLKSSNKDFLKWIDDYPLLTSSFKKKYRKIVEDAEKNDPELGLDFDPILDAQDYPSGFVVKTIDQNGFLTLQGKDWQDFIVTVKLIYEGNKFLVDGSGIINIPKDKQARR
jgi:hypothetical protein